MGNTLSASALYETYVPVDVAVLKNVADARRRGGAKMRGCLSLSLDFGARSRGKRFQAAQSRAEQRVKLLGAIDLRFRSASRKTQRNSALAVVVAPAFRTARGLTTWANQWHPTGSAVYYQDDLFPLDCNLRSETKLCLYGLPRKLAPHFLWAHLLRVGYANRREK